jgi:hypothetical protein
MINYHLLDNNAKQSIYNKNNEQLNRDFRMLYDGKDDYEIIKNPLYPNNKCIDLKNNDVLPAEEYTNGDLLNISKK